MTQNNSISSGARSKNHAAAAAVFCAGLFSWGPSATGTSFCLDFSHRPKSENFKKYDFSIHGSSSQGNIRPAQELGKKFFGYISVGEVRASAWYLDEVRDRGVNFFGENEAWNSYYVDLSDSRWADFVIDTLARGVLKKGYDGFFLDNLDTVETLMEDDPRRARQYYRGLVNLVKRLKAAYPSKQIIINRGFAVFDSLTETVDGMLVEELYQKDDYSSRSEKEIKELLDRIKPVTKAGLPIYIVDYVPRGNISLAEKTARKIQRLGFHACVIPQEIDGTVLAPEPPPTPRPGPVKPVETNYALTLRPGFNLIANQLDQGSNTLAELFPNPAEGTTIYKFDNHTRQYTINSFLGDVWLNPGQTLAPGEGAFYLNPTTSDVVVLRAGSKASSPLIGDPAAGLRLIACRRPRMAQFEDVFDFSPRDGDRVFQFRDGAYQISSYFNSTWDRLPTFHIGESFFIDLAPRPD